MLWQSVIVSVVTTLLTSVSIELVKFIKQKSRCRIKMELGDKSSGEIVSLKNMSLVDASKAQFP